MIRPHLPWNYYHHHQCNTKNACINHPDQSQDIFLHLCVHHLSSGQSVGSSDKDQDQYLFLPLFSLYHFFLFVMITLRIDFAFCLSFKLCYFSFSNFLEIFFIGNRFACSNFYKSTKILSFLKWNHTITLREITRFKGSTICCMHRCFCLFSLWNKTFSEPKKSIIIALLMGIILNLRGKKCRSTQKNTHIFQYFCFI